MNMFVSILTSKTQAVLSKYDQLLLQKSKSKYCRL